MMNDRQLLLNIIAKDGNDILNLLEYSFKLLMKDIKIAHSGIEAIGVIKNFTPSVILTDLNMSNMNRLEMIKTIKKIHPEIPIVMSGFVNNLECPELVSAVFEKPANFYAPMNSISKVTKD